MKFMSRTKNLLGKRFHMLEVISQSEKINKCSRWNCRCDCGQEVTVDCSKLTSGIKTSCGCEKRRMMSELKKIHGMSRTRIYHIWMAMKNRCYRVSSQKYADYGGRGITVCDEWHSFESFYEWSLANGYNNDLTIDRIDNNGLYSPSNCRWATVTIQSNNRRSNRHLTIDGVTRTVAEWSRYSNVRYATIMSRVKRGETGKELICSPKW